jgi:NAD-dependent dihydropyrimidine dehydrogenase PreA subunit
MRRLGTDCETCHNTRNWAGWDFNHDNTGLKLQNQHAALKCIRCHDVPVKKIRPNARCGACHGNDDTHVGAYGEKCDQCHTDLAWRNIKVGSTGFINQDSSKRQPEKTVPNKQKQNNKKKKKMQHY